MTTALPPLAPRARLRYDIVARLFTALQPRTVLEVGCGQGAVGARLAGKADYLGVEPDPTSYATAAERIEPRGGRVANTAFAEVPADALFDVVCAFEVLEHIEDDFGAAAAWAAHVRPGGHLIVSVPAFQDRYGPMDTHAGHFRRYSPAELAERLTAAGLRVDETTVYGWPVGYALEALRNRVAARELVRKEQEGGVTVAELTAASGRILQPSRRAMGAAIETAVLPFRLLQRLQPSRGVGLVAVATRPE